MAGRRIPKVLGHEGPHGLRDLGIDGRGRIVVEIDGVGGVRFRENGRGRVVQWLHFRDKSVTKQRMEWLGKQTAASQYTRTHSCSFSTAVSVFSSAFLLHGRGTVFRSIRLMGNWIAGTTHCPRGVKDAAIISQQRI